MIDNKDLEFNEKLTQEFVDKNLDVLVFVNIKTNKKLYLKPTHRMGKFIGLEPLTKAEMEDAEIQESVSETVNGEFFDMDIEESISDNEPAVKPIANFNTQDAESMKRAKRMAEEQLAKLEGKSSPDITKEALEHFQQDKENVSVELTALGLDTDPSDLRTVKDLTRAKTEVSKMRELKEEIKAKTSHSVPSGTVPLSSQTPYQQGDFMTQPHNSPIELITSLREQAKTNPRAKIALDALLRKALSAKNHSEASADLNQIKSGKKE